MRLFSRYIASILFLVSCGVTAAPVPNEDRVDIDLRRTTLIVKDIENSLAFYRDSLGLEVIYDQMIVTPRDADFASADKVRRLVFLRANDTFVGVLGLLEYQKPVKPTLDLAGRHFDTGTTVLVFNTERLEEKLAKAIDVPGARLLEGPELITYPSYDGSGGIRVMVTSLTDPDGFTIELNQLQDTLN
jgi:catechol 2,3-dioxygenase-like lactoylglutathione lyase family enzyme